MPEMDNQNDACVLFELGGTTYGLKSQEVQHMELVEHITPVPTAPAFVEGVVYSRGQVIPALNLRLRFGLPRQDHTPRSRLLIVQSGTRRVALMVDSAREFRVIPPGSILPPHDTLGSGLSGNYLEGVAPLGERLIFLLKVDELLKTDEPATREAPVGP